jgi:hypothetical protein
MAREAAKRFDSGNDRFPLLVAKTGLSATQAGRAVQKIAKRPDELR